MLYLNVNVPCITLLSISVATTSSALELHSPIHIVRPFQDVHEHCDQYVELFCGQTSSHIQKNRDVTSFEAFPETSKSAYPVIDDVMDLIADNDETQQDTEQEIENSLDGGRRLREVNSDMTSKSNKKVSISLNVRISPTNSKKLTQRAKNDKRFLNYGPDADTCLWNGFNTQQVSSECASALIYINDLTDSAPFKYEDGSKVTRVSVSISGKTLFWFIVCCILIRMVWFDYLIDDDEDDDDDDADSEDQLNSEHDGYKLIDEPKNVAFAAVPVRVV
eukprot:CAMPEP_0198273602 /NCGR_PEP_ID=MMETSP1447-20131203/57367_1 /TAXON_ID=420782 /ORGANISM="Chaetoceros dichaeta, Strain CCMP1751" /LENGTH=276 /DNA_ID=CAMNT_0043967353 /DNA_START=83 /DNA_END=913 /DNA_ORIENTATION=-